MKINKVFKKFFKVEFKDSYCSGLFSDELDKLGYQNQVILGLKLNNFKLRCFGIIRSLSIKTIKTENENIRKGLTFLDGLSESEILVVKGSNQFAYFGELMTRLSINKNLPGTIIDGLTRDSFYTKTTNFPIFARGYSPVDIKGRGRVEDTDLEFKINDVVIIPGDYIFADNDAIVVIPKLILENHYDNFNEAAKKEEETKKLIQKEISVNDLLNNVNEF